ncbi:MAG: ABC transporter permease [Erysipelotrichaceae bacterium]|nr:ABC transporter permease [Erysipelotrichaceae bacterium]
MSEKKQTQGAIAKLFGGMDVESRFGLMRMAVAIAIGLGTAIILILVCAKNPAESLKFFFLGPLQIFNPNVPKGIGWNYFDQWIQSMIPLLFTGTAVAIMFSANKFNLGLEGAIMCGGLACGWVCCLLDGDIQAPNANPVLCAILGLLVAMAAGALVTMIPALLEKKWGASIMVTSLMLNYISLYISRYCLFSTSLRDTRTSKYSWQWTEDVVLTFRKFMGTRFTLRLGLFIGIAVVIIGWAFLFKTKWGFKIRQLGQNPSFAKYVGVGIVSAGILVQVIGGAIGGLCGATVILGNYNYYYGVDLTGYGWDGVTMAIFAGNNPKKVLPAALFIAYIRAGASIMATQPGGPINELTKIVEGVIVLFLLAEKFLAKTHRKMIVEEAKRKQALKAVTGEEVAK